MSWRQHALCKGKNLDLWYPPLESTNHNDFYAIGKLVCYRCPVWKECLQSASNETWGMWGGLTPQERKGTVKTQHGSLEMFRLGCSCTECIDVSKKVLPKLDITQIPKPTDKVEAKSLLYGLIEV